MSTATMSRAWFLRKVALVLRRGLGRAVPDAGHIAGHRALGDDVAELQEFPVDPRSAYVAFSRTISRMRRRISARVVGRPAKDPRHQKRRNARRCQATTVSGLTRTQESFQPLQ
jgi:hypothetical protein